jgi:hypothetical protein
MFSLSAYTHDSLPNLNNLMCYIKNYNDIRKETKWQWFLRKLNLRQQKTGRVCKTQYWSSFRATIVAVDEQ